jgi:hypothetical protein
MVASRIAFFGTDEQPALTIGGFPPLTARAWENMLEVRNTKPVTAASAAGLRNRALTSANLASVRSRRPDHSPASPFFSQ